ncbi:MAG: sigma-70 family RNA polymerase sigma factor [Phycisphaerales bacterium]|nr:MAG: sigma-70 family RNA polymerase sigma factor [Phycisphaerales bacterium]
MAGMSDNDTDMGGVGREFMTTHWSMIEKAADAENDRDQLLIDLLIERYWKPVYCYLRRKGCGNEEAKDITQGFFHEVVLGRHLIEKADPDKGRFRSLLLNALNFYLIDVYHKESAKRRIPKSKLKSMDDLEWANVAETVTTLTPEDAFTYSWVSTLLEHVIDEVDRYCDRTGKSVHWKVFYERTLSPIMENTAAPGLESVCKTYHLSSTQQASNMIATVKRRFQTVLRQYLRDTVTSDEEAEAELNEIRRFLPHMSE